MLYLFEAELSENKNIFISLTRIYGIGKSSSFLLCKKLGLSKNLKVKNLSKDQISKIIKTVDTLNFILASDLKKIKTLVFKKLVSIKAYKGLRRSQGLPVRGQRTHTNARTAKKIKL